MVRSASAPPGRKVQRRGEPVVRKVLAVTLQLLSRVGYQRLSVAEVASRAGLNKTSVYRRWPTKQALVRDALEQSMEHAHLVPDTGELRADLLVLAEQTTAFIRSRQGKGLLRVMFAEGPHPEVRRLVASMAQRNGLDALQRVCRRAVDRGELRPDLNTERVLFTLAGALMHRVFIEQKPTSGTFLEELVDLILFGAADEGAD